MTTTLFERDDRFTASRVRELHRIVENERLAGGETRFPEERQSTATRHRWVVGPAAVAAFLTAVHRT